MGDPEIIVPLPQGPTSIVIIVTGTADPKCLEDFKAEVEKAAQHCGLTVKGVTVKKFGGKPKPKKKPKKK